MWAKAAATMILAASAFGGAAQAQSVLIEDAVARVIYRPSDRTDFQVEVVGESVAGLSAVAVSRVGNDLKISGGLASDNRRLRLHNCTASTGDAPPSQPGQGASVSVPQLGLVRAEDAPLIIINGPRDASIRTSGAVFGTITRGVENVKLDVGGCGAWVVPNTERQTDINIGGHGQVWIGSVDKLTVKIGGNGHVRTARAQAVDVGIGGSGRVYIQNINGPMDVGVAGAGTVRVAEGHIDRLNARIMGSGDLDVGATVGNLNATIMGAGNIEVERVTGEVKRRVVGVGLISIHHEGH